MRTSNIGGIGSFALTACIFISLAVCKPIAAPALTPTLGPAITTLSVGNLAPQTVTALYQTVTYAETITTTSTDLTCYRPGTYSQGCFTTVVATPGIYTLQSPQEIDYYCPYEVFEQFTACPGCQKNVVAQECQFGYCNFYLLNYVPGPTSTQTWIVSEISGWGCTPSVAGGGVAAITPVSATFPTVTAPSLTFSSATLPAITSPSVASPSITFSSVASPSITSLLPTTTVTSTIPSGVGYTTTVGHTVVVVAPAPLVSSTTYLASGSFAFTQTIGGTVVFGFPYSTVLSTLPAGASGFTSTSLGTVIVGSPSSAVTATPTLPPLSFTTITVALPATASAYTSTGSGRVIIGSPSSSFIASTSVTPLTSVVPSSSFVVSASIATSSSIASNPALPSVSNTASVPLTIPNFPPFPTATSYSYFAGAGIATTITSGGICIIEQPYVTKTLTLPAGASGYTAFALGTEIIGSPLSPSSTTVTTYITITSYFTGAGNGYTTTAGTSVVVGLPFSKQTLSLPATASPYTSTASGGTIVIGSPIPYVTATAYTAGVGTTVTNGGTIVDDLPYSTSVSYLVSGSAYTSTLSGGSLVVGQPIVTKTTYLASAGTSFKQTLSGTEIDGIPYVTQTTTISAGVPGYTSIIPASGSADGTVLVGQALPYITETSYLDNGGSRYTSTLGGYVIIGLPVATYTVGTTIAAGNSAFTSTIPASGSVPGTVIVATPIPYVSATSYISGGGGANGGSAYTITTQGSAIVYEPYVTVTSYVNTATGGVATTITNGGTLTICKPYALATSYVASAGSAYSTTVGGTIYEVTAYITSTSYINTATGGVATTITNGGTLTICTPYALATSYVASAGSAYSTTVGGTIYDVTAYITSTSYIYSGTYGTTFTTGNSVVIVSALPTVTVTNFFGATGAFSGSGGPVYTSTVPAAGSAAGTVIVGYLQGIVTIFSTGGTILGTQTIAASATAAETVVIGVPTACNNAGLQMAAYTMPSALNDDDSTFSSFDPTIYKTLTPSQTDTSTSPYFNCPEEASCTITNATTPLTVTPTLLVIDYHGYFIPPTTGSYTFTSKYADDIILLWFGSSAYSGWTRSNAVLVATYGNFPGDNQVHSYTVPLVAGLYYPIRIMYGNAEGPGHFELDLTGPTGQQVFFTGSNLVSASCDGVLAPAFPPYGKET